MTQGHSEDQLAVRKFVQRACTNRAVRDVLMAAFELGARVTRTSSGVVVFGPNGTAGTHMTNSDRRAALNLAADLRRIGIPIGAGDQHRTAAPPAPTQPSPPSELRTAWGSPRKWTGRGRFGVLLSTSTGAEVTDCTYDPASDAWVTVDDAGRAYAYGSSVRGRADRPAVRGDAARARHVAGLPGPQPCRGGRRPLGLTVCAGGDLPHI